MTAWPFRIGVLALGGLVWWATGDPDVGMTWVIGFMIAFIDYRLIMLERVSSEEEKP